MSESMIKYIVLILQIFDYVFFAPVDKFKEKRISIVYKKTDELYIKW